VRLFVLPRKIPSVGIAVHIQGDGYPVKVMGLEHSSLNRTQRLVLGFFFFAWVALVVILVAAPEVYEQALLRLPGGERKLPTLAFLAAISAFLVLLGVGVVRRWRLMFWLVLVAFLIGGVLRVPASILQLSGVLSADFPAWYVLLQALIGVVQVGIGVLMLVGYRREGVWGRF
jgi:hypothetical protein